MASLNRVLLMGNLTRDPEIRYTPKGTAVTDLGIAVNRRYRVEDEVREEVTFVDVTFWGRQAETVGKYLNKGRAIFVEGRLQMDSWEDKATGQKRNRLKIIGESFQFIGSREGGGSSGGGGGYSGGDSHSGGQSAPSPDSPPPSSGPSPSVNDEPDDPIPF